MPNSCYVGRFAPSPTGPLHLGSLFAAVISYCDAKFHNGVWRLRIDDLDTPRVQPDAINQQLQQLDAFGLGWDGEVYYQSQQAAAYLAALDDLQAKQACYACHCSRQMIRERQQGRVQYDNFCRHRHHPFDLNQAWRLILPEQAKAWHDDWCGEQVLFQPVEDPIIWRRDQIVGYHLACAWDEWAMGITHVVRGQDLLTASWPQTLLRQHWHPLAPELVFKHHPLLANHQGLKLSKSANSPAVWPNQGALYKIAQVFGIADQLNAKMPDELVLHAIKDYWAKIVTEFLTPTTADQPSPILRQVSVI